MALKLAKEIKARFHQSSLVVDPDDYDFQNIDKIPSSKLLIFVVSEICPGEGFD